MKIVQLTQGTPEWHAHRAQHYNASDAPAMLGCSPYKSRQDLLREVATGIVPEVDAATQKRFDDGHRFEAWARTLAEEIIGEELFPCVGVADGGIYSASFDGLTLLEDTAWEHKSLNNELRAAMVDGCTGADLPKLYRVQMEQQALVSGAERVLFMASKWDAAGDLIEERHCWYTPDPELRAEIIAGWEQFDLDVDSYQTEPAAAPEAVGRAPDQLPALHIEVTGMVTASNLHQWKDAAIAVFQGISTDLTTDQDFADAEKTVKWCGEIEDQLKAAKQHALGQTASIDELFRTIDAISAEARAKRLELDKLVKSRKEAVRTEILTAGREAVRAHVDQINSSLGQHAIPLPATLTADLAAAIKGKKSFTSMRDAVDATVANAKIASSQTAERVRANVAILAKHDDHASLFADRILLCASKSPEDLGNLVAARIADFEAREAKRLEEERERIRKEEAERLEREQLEAAQAREAEKAPPTPPADAEASAAAEPVATARSTVASVASAGAAPTPAGARIKLGDLNELIAPISITAQGLASIGFKPVGSERAAKLYALADLPAICTKLGQIVEAAPARAAQKKAA
ncbi:lambda-exonuclease family protein [Marilutibacter spongiae]|uniref:YqaJ viral recombinase family protein n=1 Tax=Marilutibacter spongiae TaxID=2025720 RepID=A0A7W3TL68_9GAMM|nr:YqaJ viral recombinase family protein [Lysobacter spongiae]MBB1060382.1 YqaJ viral recombinase family protein [Lysobacter spongiae]